MSNIKRPRPAVPVLVHVDNPSGGDSAEITEEVKSLSNSVGTLSDSAQRRSLVAMTSDMRKALNDSTEAVENIHSNIGTTTDLITDTTVIGLLKKIKENTTGGGGGSGEGVDMTTVNTNTTKISNVLGDVSEESTSGTILGQLKQTNQTLGTVRSTTASEDLFGKISTIRNYTENNNGKLVDIKKTIGEAGDVVSASTISGRLHSIAYVTGNQNDQASVNTISGKLSAVKNLLNNNYENTAAIKSTVGKVSDESTGTTISARLAAIKSATTSNYSVVDNLRDHVGYPSDNPTDNTVIGLLKGIKESGGSGTGADMTTVNTKTTAINAAIGATSDESTANTVIGLLKRIIQNN